MRFLGSAFSAAVIFIATTQSAHAMVDMKNGNYTDTMIDLQVSGGGYALKIERTYNSRSNFSGMYGYGWCSEQETTLEKTPEGFLKLQQCGAGQEFIFKPKTATANADVDKTVNAIATYYKSINSNASETTIDTLKDQVRNDINLRSRWAKEAKYSGGEVKKGTVFVSETLEVEKIEYDGSVYTRTLSDGGTQKFNTSGRMTAQYDKNGNSLKLNYTGENLKDVVDNMGRKLSFTYYPNRRVKDITGPNGFKAEYKYNGEDLVEVKNQWKNTYKFDYDSNHNLTKIVFPDKSFKALTYDQKNDLVTSFGDRALDGAAPCKESYEYFTDKDSPKDHFWSNAVKKCASEVKNEARFEFWLKTRGDGKRYLYRMLNRTLNETLDITYHAEFGRPIVLKKGGQTTTYDYFANGLVKEKSTAFAKLNYEYNKTYNKVSKVTTEFLDTKGKVVKKRDTNFDYDNRGNLSLAQNSDGQLVKLTYDQRGRVETIVDQAKKLVQITYDERLGKPTKITRPKVGSIDVSYRANGEINKVDSNDGPTVATQVASTFNNLLDIIAPATSELNL